MNHIAKVKPEKAILTKKKHAKILRNISLLNLNDTKIIEIDIRIFIKNDKIAFGSGSNMYKEYIAPSRAPKISRNLLIFKYKNLETDSKIK